MVTSELGACEWFIWDLRQSNLIDRGQLDQIIGEFMQSNPRAEPPALAQFLVQKEILSQFQADRLLQGKTQGFVLGPFTLMDALGAGSMGTVYKAQSKSDHKTYAVKVLPRRSMWNVRVARRKVRAFEACKHPAVVPFVDVGTAGSMHYLAWPFVAGDGLDKVVQAHGKIKPGVAAYYALQVAEALEVCHQQALFHGLLKPSNLMIGAGGQVYILDFGIGCLLAETEGESLVDTMSTANSVASGLDCASPESIMDPTNLTPAGDQYSLGCVLYYCLTGQFPFPDGSSAEKMMAHQFNEPTPLRELNPEVPLELVDVVKRLMQKVPDNRFASAGAVVDALQLLAEVPAAGAAAPPPPPPRVAGGARPASAGPRLSATETEKRGQPVGPSTMTPLPQGTLPLPSRETIQAVAATPAPAKRLPERLQPQVVDLDDTEAPSWDERIGPVGVAAIAIGTCLVAWALMTLVL
jgi:serine/threonine protein kinase